MRATWESGNRASKAQRGFVANRLASCKLAVLDVVRRCPCLQRAENYFRMERPAGKLAVLAVPGYGLSSYSLSSHATHNAAHAGVR